MGLIKTAMMSGAAMYGVNQIAKTAQNRSSNNSSAPRSDRRHDYYPDHDESYRPSTLQFRDRNSQDSQSQRYSRSVSDMQAREDNAGHYMPSQRLYLEEARSYDPNTFNYTRGEQELPYRAGARSLSPAPAYYSSQPRQQQRGFVEPEELRDDPRGAQRNGADMMNMLAQQAMGMGLMGGKNGKKDKDSKGDFLSQVLGK